jgi:hypothetical protein
VSKETYYRNYKNPAGPSPKVNKKNRNKKLKDIKNRILLGLLQKSAPQYIYYFLYPLTFFLLRPPRELEWSCWAFSKSQRPSTFKKIEKIYNCEGIGMVQLGLLKR